MHMKAIVAERGQFTIPKKIRETLGISPGTVLEVNAEAGKLVAHKMHESGVDAVYGILGRKVDTDKIMSELRGRPFPYRK